MPFIFHYVGKGQSLRGASSLPNDGIIRVCSPMNLLALAASSLRGQTAAACRGCFSSNKRLHTTKDHRTTPFIMAESSRDV